MKLLRGILLIGGSCLVLGNTYAQSERSGNNQVSPLDFLTISKFDDKSNKDRLFKIKVGTFTSSGTTVTQSIMGIGFKPRLILLGIGIGASDSIVAGLGWADSKTQVAIFGFRSDDTDTGGQGIDTSTVIRWTDTGGTVVGQAALVSLDQDGFTLLWSAAEAQIVSYLVIE